MKQGGCRLGVVNTGYARGQAVYGMLTTEYIPDVRSKYINIDTIYELVQTVEFSIVFVDSSI